MLVGWGLGVDERTVLGDSLSEQGAKARRCPFLPAALYLPQRRGVGGVYSSQVGSSLLHLALAVCLLPLPLPCAAALLVPSSCSPTSSLPSPHSSITLQGRQAAAASVTSKMTTTRTKPEPRIRGLLVPGLPSPTSSPPRPPLCHRVSKAAAAAVPCKMTTIRTEPETCLGDLLTPHIPSPSPSPPPCPQIYYRVSKLRPHPSPPR